MSTIIPDNYDSIINNALYVWLTTVREDGMPLPTPVWFVREGDSFVIYTIPGTKKIENLQSNPHVSLSFTPDADAGNYFVILGTARVDQSIPLSIENVAYAEKYKEQIAEIGVPPESLSEQYNVPIRVTAMRIRGLEWE